MNDRPYIDFQEVKEKCPIPEVLAKLGILDQFTRKGDVLTGICPIPLHQHGPEPNKSQFKIDRKRGLWLYKCFGDCSDKPYGGGDVIALVKAVKQLSDEHVRFWFASEFGDRLSTVKPGKESRSVATQSNDDETIENTQPSSVETTPLKPMSFYLNLDPEVPYLKERGIEQATIERYGIGLCTKGMFNGYVAMPCYRWPKEQPDENPVGYVGRWPGDDFDDDRPRYKGGFEVSRIVYGLDEALAVGSGSTPLIVVEGPFKVFYLVQHGYGNTVSTFTSSVSDEQADILIATGRPIVLCFDADEAGQNGMRRGAAKLIAKSYVRVVKLEQGKEPDQLSAQELEQFFGFSK